MASDRDSGLDSWADHGIVISCQGLRKDYGNVVAVRNLDIQVASGRVLGLVGPNGAGKTTTMRCMAGIIPATQGDVRIAGHIVGLETVEAKANLCFVPDTPHLFNYLTVEEHLRFHGRIHGLADIEQRIERLLATFELRDKARSLPQALSRGMKQKVAICIGFLHDPKAIFLDEPLTGLDPMGIRRMKDAIVERAKKHNAAVIVSSHQLELVEEICDETLVLKNGEKVVSGTIDQLHDFLGVEQGALSLEALFFRLTEDPATESSAQHDAMSES